MDYVDALYDKIEDILPMEGPMSIPARAVIGAGLGYLVIAAIRPDFAYDQSGNVRPWAVCPDLYQGAGSPTHLPFFVGPLLGSILLAGFV